MHSEWINEQASIRAAIHTFFVVYDWIMNWSRYFGKWL
jgi:hypothetical protein